MKRTKTQSKQKKKLNKLTTKKLVAGGYTCVTKFTYSWNVNAANGGKAAAPSINIKKSVKSVK